LDHQLTGLLGFADVAATFSYEALKLDVTVFNLMNSGDGHSSKEEVGVAASMRTLLNDSKFVGREIVYQVCDIVTAHGMIRENAKSLHSRIRVELNSDHNKEKLTIGSEPMCCVLLSLAMSLKVLGQGSLARANCNLSSIDRRHDFYSGLFDVFKKECPTDASLVNNFNESFKFYSGGVYDKFAHEINVLFSLVWKIVAWELVTAYVALEAAELNETKKRKKAGLGKGTSLIFA
jgi:histidyl-tRNA synthetase